MRQQKRIKILSNPNTPYANSRWKLSNTPEGHKCGLEQTEWPATSSGGKTQLCKVVSFPSINLEIKSCLNIDTGCWFAIAPGTRQADSKIYVEKQISKNRQQNTRKEEKQWRGRGPGIVGPATRKTHHKAFQKTHLLSSHQVTEELLLWGKEMIQPGLKQLF